MFDREGMCRTNNLSTTLSLKLALAGAHATLRYTVYDACLRHFLVTALCLAACAVSRCFAQPEAAVNETRSLSLNLFSKDISAGAKVDLYGLGFGLGLLIHPLSEENVSRCIMRRMSALTEHAQVYSMLRMMVIRHADELSVRLIPM